MSNNNEAQERFDRTYMTSREICKRLKINRTTILQARIKGTLPQAIVINDGHLVLWEREIAEPFVAEWEKKLKMRRKESVA